VRRAYEVIQVRQVIRVFRDRVVFREHLEYPELLVIEENRESRER